MNGRCVISTNKQLISEKDTFFWLSRGNLKAETEDELIAVQKHVCQNKYYMEQKHYNQKQIANADYVEKTTRQ